MRPTTNRAARARSPGRHVTPMAVRSPLFFFFFSRVFPPSILTSQTKPFHDSLTRPPTAVGNMVPAIEEAFFSSPGNAKFSNDREALYNATNDTGFHQKLEIAITAAFEKIDVEVKRIDQSGTTAVVVLLKKHGPNGDVAVKCAWCGDSRAVMAKNFEYGAGGLVDLSSDHKPEVPSEQARIERHYKDIHGDNSFKSREAVGRRGDGNDGSPKGASPGGTQRRGNLDVEVTIGHKDHHFDEDAGEGEDTFGEMKGPSRSKSANSGSRISYVGFYKDTKTGQALSKERVFSSSGESHGVSRSIGDRGAARACVATPDFKNTILSASGGGRIVIASDGVWDCYSSQKAMATIKGVSKVDTAAKKMCVAAREKREYGGFSMDDISVIVVDVGKWKPSSGGEGKQPGGCSCVVQ